LSALPRVLLLAAVEEELAPLRSRLGALESFCAPELVVTGVGKINTACEAALAMRSLAPALSMQVGCAGAYPRAGLSLGDVVIADHEILGDEGVEASKGFLDLAEIGFAVAMDGGRPIYNEIPTRRPRFESWKDLLAQAAGRYAIRSGPLVTLSTGSGTQRRALEIQARWSPLAESMEGAAAALVALRHGCPFFEVRGISNQAGERDRSAWDVKTACEHAAEVAVRLLSLEVELAGT
jgi:futalosine hydrolase